jgi:hypothetical protein
VRNRNKRTFRIRFGVHDPNVGRCLLVEERSVDRSCNFMVHFIGKAYALVTS